MLIDGGAVTIRDAVSSELLFTWLYFRNGNLSCTYCPQEVLIKYFPQSTFEMASVQTEVAHTPD